jgi:hypothetical protein
MAVTSFSPRQRMNLSRQEKNVYPRTRNTVFWALKAFLTYSPKLAILAARSRMRSQG